MIENPAKCPICNAHWDWGTTWIGQLVALHPPTPCIPVPVVERAEEDEASDFETRCEECRKWFIPGKHSAHSQIVCGTICRQARRDRKHKESEERCRLTRRVA